MAAEIHVYVDPARLAHQPSWRDAVREAGFELQLPARFDLTQAAGAVPCRYRGEQAAFEYRHEALDPTASDNTGIAAPLGLRLTFAGAQAGAVPALICAAVVCARLDGLLLDPAAAAPVQAIAAIAWATDFETLSDDEYRRQHQGQPPPFLQARQRRRRLATIGFAASVIALPCLIWAGMQLYEHYERKRYAEEMERYAEQSARAVEQAQRQYQERRAAEKAARDAALARAAAEAAAEAAALEAKIAALSDADYAFVPAEAPNGRKRWLFGYRQAAEYYAFDARGACGKELLHREWQVLFPASRTPPPDPTSTPAVTVPALALAPLRAAHEHLPREWTLITTDGSRKIEMSAQATEFASVPGPCLYLLTTPFEPQKEKAFGILGERIDHRTPIQDLALAYPGDLHDTALRAAEPMTWLPEDMDQPGLAHQISEGMALLKTDARLRALLRQAQADSPNEKIHMRVGGFQDFRAIFTVERGSEVHRLYFFQNAAGLPLEFWAMMRMNDQQVVAVSPLRDSFRPELVAMVDVDGDGIDELLFRAYLYEGTQLRLLKLVGRNLRQLGESTYIGL